ncbi:hypothetical protein DA83_11220 [Pseudomonas sp. 250J]|nr:hypothetical protein DA83_11220 [Pseudomonas sp. 250J]
MIIPPLRNGRSAHHDRAATRNSTFQQHIIKIINIFTGQLVGYKQAFIRIRVKNFHWVIAKHGIRLSL